MQDLFAEAQRAASRDPDGRSAVEWFERLAGLSSAIERPAPGRRTAVQGAYGRSGWNPGGRGLASAGKRTRTMALAAALTRSARAQRQREPLTGDSTQAWRTEIAASSAALLPAPRPAVGHASDTDASRELRVLPQRTAPAILHGGRWLSRLSSRRRRAHESVPARLRSPLPGTIAPVDAFMRLFAREVVSAASPLFGGARVAASAADATVQSEINAGGSARATAEAALQAASDAGQSLPPAIVERMGRALDHTFSHVRIHTGPSAAAAAQALGARAFTLGSHIYFAEGAWAPGSKDGDCLLRHELTHVAQFDRGLLRAGGRGLEIAEPHSETEREARAAEDRVESSPTPPRARGQAAPRPASGHDVRPIGSGRATSPAPASGPASARARAAGAARGRGATTATPPAAGVASPFLAEGALIDVVRMVSPRLASLVEGGVDGQVTSIVNSAIQSGLRALVPSNPLAGLSSVGASIAEIGQHAGRRRAGRREVLRDVQRLVREAGRSGQEGRGQQVRRELQEGLRPG